MATTKITNPELFDLSSLNSALQLPSGTTAQRPTSPSTGEWRYNTDNNLIEFWDGGAWFELQDEVIPPIPSEHFNTVLYTGNSSTQSITGVGFQPDFIWIKRRNSAEPHAIYDSTRGINKQLESNSSAAEATNTAPFEGVNSFDSDGFTTGDNGGTNRSPNTYVAWCLKGGGNSNTYNVNGVGYATRSAAGLNNGTIPDANFLGASVNTKAGFSIQHINGSGVSGGSTIDTGLTQQAELLIIKRLDSAGSWVVPQSITNEYSLLDTTAAGTSITFSNYSSGTNNILYDFYEYICYTFHSVAGFSKIGSYVGNGSTNGPIVNTGFEPAYVMSKNLDNAESWYIWDNKRDLTNPRYHLLLADASDAEYVNQTNYALDFLSNGFQLRNTVVSNANGNNYIYIAFAADPSTATPTLADSFNIATYTGNGGTNTIQGFGFTPSMIWFKERANQGYDHGLYDNVRGVQNLIYPDLTNAENNVSPNGLQSFNSDGVTVGSNNKANASGSTYAGWAWKANSIPTINTDGTITSVVSANANSGFSIVKYTGNGTASSTIGHGLSSAPDVVFFKRLDAIESWNVWFSSVSNKVGFLNLSQAFINYTGISSSATTVTLNNGTGHNAANSPYIAYCFASTSGFSQIGTYAGNGTSQTITTGFQVDYLMLRKQDDTQDWFIFDSVRDPSNPKTKRLFANLASTEVTSTSNINFTPTGFELPTAFFNDTGKNFVYMTFSINQTARDLDFLVIAGGGGAGQSVAPVPFSSSGKGGAGGGAGGLRTSYGSTSGGGSNAESGLSLTAGTYTITVGSGGSGGSGGGSASSGTNSVILTPDSTSIISTGGGYGGGYDNGLGGVGGSGGGAASKNSGTFPNRGIGTAGQGFDGGYGWYWYDSSVPVTIDAGGGGGGAASRGLPSSNVQSTRQNSSGGDGLAVSVTGSSVTYAAGGRGTQGSPNNNGSGWTGNANTGDGGQGNYNSSGGAGASGVVVLRMPTASYSGTTTGSPTVTTDGSDTILTYTGSGTYVHS